MRSTWKWNRILALLTALCMIVTPVLAFAEEDDMFTVGIISVKTAKLNPLYTEEREFKSVNSLIYESLMVLDDDYMPQYGVVRSYDMNNDASKWTFHLRDDVYFHDGSKMTAYDVLATINEILRLAEEGQGQYATLKYMIKSVEVRDETTLIITASRKYYGFLYAMTFPILPESQVQADNPVGSGPYYAQAFSPGDYIYLTAWRNWWKGTPQISQVNVLLFNTNRDLISAYEYNRIDAAVTRSSNATQYSRSATSLSITYRTQQLETLMINRASFPLDDPAVRQAIRFAVNPDILASTAYQGMCARTDTPMPQGTWMYQGNDSAYRYDPERAKELLAEAGWFAAEEDAILHKVVDGKTRNLHVRLYVYEEQDNSVRVAAANLIKSQLEAVGFGVTVSSLTFSQAAEKLKAASYDLCLAAFQMDAVPDPGFLLMRGNTGNYSRYSSTAMDQLFTTLRASPLFADYKQTLYDIQDRFAQDCPFICLYYRTGAIMTRKMFTTARDIREPDLFRGIESYQY